eukprot:30835-Pelagococcus_subviridis.AAC.33
MRPPAGVNVLDSAAPPTVSLNSVGVAGATSTPLASAFTPPRDARSASVAPGRCSDFAGSGSARTASSSARTTLGGSDALNASPPFLYTTSAASAARPRVRKYSTGSDGGAPRALYPQFASSHASSDRSASDSNGRSSTDRSASRDAACAASRPTSASETAARRACDAAAMASAATRNASVASPHSSRIATPSSASAAASSSALAPPPVLARAAASAASGRPLAASAATNRSGVAACAARGIDAHAASNDSGLPQSSNSAAALICENNRGCILALAAYRAGAPSGSNPASRSAGGDADPEPNTSAHASAGDLNGYGGGCPPTPSRRSSRNKHDGSAAGGSRKDAAAAAAVVRRTCTLPAQAPGPPCRSAGRDDRFSRNTKDVARARCAHRTARSCAPCRRSWNPPSPSPPSPPPPPPPRGDAPSARKTSRSASNTIAARSRSDPAPPALRLDARSSACSALFSAAVAHSATISPSCRYASTPSGEVNSSRPHTSST